MKIKTKTEKYGFAFNKETSELLKRISKETDLSQVKIVQRGIELFAKERGLK